jgi:hypothetical protein
MSTIALPLLSTLFGLFQSCAFLHLEVLALRQQLAMVNQTPRKTTAASLGSAVVLGLGLALPPMAGLYTDTAGLETGYPGALALQGLSTVLELEVSLPDGRAPTHRT